MGGVIHDVSDLTKAGRMPADVTEGAQPMAPPVLARAFAAKMLTAQVRDDERALPADIPAECELLAALLWSGTFAPGRLVAAVVSDLIDSPAIFFLPAHRAIWEACLSVSEGGLHPTSTALHSAMRAKRSERSGGGLNYLDTLVRDAKPMSEASARGHAQTIRDAWVRRNIIASAMAIEAAARTGKSSADDVAAMAVNSIAEAAGTAAVANKSYIKLSKALGDMIRELQATIQPAVFTGFRDIDEATGGLRRKETSIMAARTSVGKSLLTSQWSEHISGNEKTPTAVYYVSLEMKASLFAARMASSRARVDAKKMRRGGLNPDEFGAVIDAANRIKELHMYFVDSLAQSMRSILDGAVKLRKNLHAKGITLGLVVIDHVGLVKPIDSSWNRKRHEQVGETSRALRNIATELDCHVIGIAQINRDAAKRNGEAAIPKLHELKDCGGLEEDADNVFILHRQRSAKGVFLRNAGADFIVAKARNDSTAELKLSFDEDHVCFGDWNGHE